MEALRCNAIKLRRTLPARRGRAATSRGLGVDGVRLCALAVAYRHGWPSPLSDVGHKRRLHHAALLRTHQAVCSAQQPVAMARHQPSMPGRMGPGGSPRRTAQTRRRKAAKVIVATPPVGYPGSNTCVVPSYHPCSVRAANPFPSRTLLPPRPSLVTTASPVAGATTAASRSRPLPRRQCCGHVFRHMPRRCGPDGKSGSSHEAVVRGGGLRAAAWPITHGAATPRLGAGVRWRPWVAGTATRVIGWGCTRKDETLGQSCLELKSMGCELKLKLLAADGRLPARGPALRRGAVHALPARCNRMAWEELTHARRVGVHGRTTGLLATCTWGHGATRAACTRGASRGATAPTPPVTGLDHTVRGQPVRLLAPSSRTGR